MSHREQQYMASVSTKAVFIVCDDDLHERSALVSNLLLLC